MITFKIKEMLLASGKAHPATWLIKHCGFSKNKAHNIVHAKQGSVSLEDLTTLCENLNCSLNDLFYWRQTARHTLPAGHPCLTQMTAPDGNEDWFTIFKKLSPDLVKKVHDYAVDTLKEKKEPEIKD